MTDVGVRRSTRPPADPEAPRTEAALAALHRHYASTHSPAALSELVGRYSALVTWLARRHAQPHDRADYEQVAYLALIKALRRFDPDRGVAFSTFAYATISGELKRATRDTSWSAHVTRTVQERYIVVGRALEELTHQLHRTPTLDEIADAVGCTLEEVVETVDAGDNRAFSSLDGSAASRVGREPVEPASVEDVAEAHLAVTELLAILPPRQRRIVELRFLHEYTQSEIACRLGISQMHVSRLLRSALEQLRAAVPAYAGGAGAQAGGRFPR